jgi:hypothetical protein
MERRWEDAGPGRGMQEEGRDAGAEGMEGETEPTDGAEMEIHKEEV